MIRKAEYTEWIDSFLFNELAPDQKKEFEAELNLNAALVDELNLHIELQDALSEKDVINLRKNLNSILKSSSSQAEKIKASFDLIEDLDEFSEFETKIDPKELLNYYESLPKLHIYQHEIASKENVHHFYKEQEHTKAIVEEEDSISDEALMAEIEEAITEKDVLQLRDNLKQVALNMQNHDYNHEQIDDYLNNEMPGEEAAEFEKELAINSWLAADVRLHSDIEKSILETDVINLRAELSNIMETQTSYHQEFDEIEQYLENDLSAAQLAEFENDMFENKGLRTDVKLHREVELASTESEVMNLRDNLRNIRNDVETREEKSIIKLNVGWQSVFVRYAAAVAILLAFGVTLMIRLQPVSNEQLYDKYFVNTEAIGSTRGTNNEDMTLVKGKELYNSQNYEEASLLFQLVIDKDKNNAIPRFFLGSSYQNLKKSLEAINEYKMVVANKENTYRDLAEFNIGLCFIIQDDRKLAIDQFKRIANNGNEYRQQAQAILRELKYEDKE
jgi:hypothetical protein